MLQSTPAPNILLIRLSALGDILQTLPVLSVIRHTYPDATIGWVVDAQFAPLLAGHPDIDYLHVCRRRQWVRNLCNPLAWWATWQDIRAFFRGIRTVGYTVGIDLQGLLKTALILFCTGIEHRIGHGHGREGSHWFYTKTYGTAQTYFAPNQSHLSHMIQLVEAIGCTPTEPTVRLPDPPETARQKVADLLVAGFSQHAPIVAMAPATQWPSKHWPGTHWTALLHAIIVQTDLNVVVLGTIQDQGLIAEILAPIPAEQRQGRILNLAGLTTLTELQAVYEQVTVAIGLDSAPLQMAGAMHVPHLIGLYGPTAYRRTPPFGSPDIRLLSTEDELPCQPCHKRICPLGTLACMAGIQPEQIFETLQQVQLGAGHGKS